MILAMLVKSNQHRLGQGEFQVRRQHVCFPFQVRCANKKDLLDCLCCLAKIKPGIEPFSSRQATHRCRASNKDSTKIFHSLYIIPIKQQQMSMKHILRCLYIVLYLNLLALYITKSNSHLLRLRRQKRFPRAARRHIDVAAREDGGKSHEECEKKGHPCSRLGVEEDPCGKKTRSFVMFCVKSLKNVP